MFTKEAEKFAKAYEKRHSENNSRLSTRLKKSLEEGQRINKFLIEPEELCMRRERTKQGINSEIKIRREVSRECQRDLVKAFRKIIPNKRNVEIFQNWNPNLIEVQGNVPTNVFEFLNNRFDVKSVDIK